MAEDAMNLLSYGMLLLCWSLRSRSLCAFQSARMLSFVTVSRGPIPSLLFAATTNGQVASLSVGQTFTSEPIKVYIEDTDTYGVIYNANYVKFYDRALFTARSTLSQTETGVEEVMVSVGNQKFRSSPGLGDEFVIQGILKDIDQHQREIWDLTMKSLDGEKIYHSADDVVLAKSDVDNWLSEAPVFENDAFHERSDTFIAYRDEFDQSMSSHIPLTSVLKLLERPRTNVLGGPKTLRSLADDGIIVVVSGISQLCLLKHNRSTLVGDTLQVHTFSKVFKGGMKTVMYQTITDSTGQRIAQGIVTLFALNKKTFRPTSRLPAGLVDQIVRNGLLEGHR